MSYQNNFLNTIHGIPYYGRGEDPFHNFFCTYNMENDNNTIINKDNEYVVSLDVPGVSKDNLEVKVDNKLLTVKTIQENQNNKEYRKYMYSVKIPDNVETEKIDIILTQGVLKITFPKSDVAKPRVLNIKEVD